jgi:hypothetical protein
MKMYEMKKAGRYGIGFIDPNTVNQAIWEDQYSREDTERFLLEFLKQLNTQPKILLPYNFG